MLYLENLVHDHHKVWIIPKEFPGDNQVVKHVIILN